MKDLFVEKLLRPLRQAEGYRLSAVLELSQLSTEQLESLAQREHGILCPLMQQDELSNLRPFGTGLYAANTDANLQNQSDLFWQLSEFAADAICGWIISSLPTAALATHLAQANTVRAPDGQRYLLRYHTEQCLRVLHARKDLPKIVEWFAPIHSWWVPYPDANEETWCCLMGGDRSATEELNDLTLDPACWEALAGDPLEHRLADQLKSSLAASGQAKQCHSVRLGRVRKYLAAAREAGFIEQQDLITYVTYSELLGDRLTLDPIWQAAMKESLEQRQPFAHRLQTHLHRLLH
ncbi:DUF4123 domain-containing protein [uncultured Pseudomonas sp.]|uniref:DUF4123 domain-containing protein n=1 Tax=uncultured Pseudomonas sp. TaxID=114707 RepID=UPI0025898FC0|nr:DUF4123 domain-containing protein [uncultured Pseudomonas sp.]